MTLVNFLRGEHLELLYEKLRAGSGKESNLTIWEPVPMTEGLDGEGEGASEWEALIPKIHYPRSYNWWKVEFNRWKHLVAQGHGIEKGWLIW